MLPQENPAMNDLTPQSPLFPLQTQFSASMVPYPRFPYQAPPTQMDFGYYNYGYSDAPYYFVPTQPMDAGKLSEYINPLMQQRIQKAQLAHQFPESRAAGSFKTVMCQSWLETATCKYGNDCKFAHGETELRYARPPIKNPKKYKTRLCEKYTVRGVCPYGNRCLFIHPDPAQMMAVPPPPGLGMTSENYKHYVTIPQPSLMSYLPLPTQPFSDLVSISSSSQQQQVPEEKRVYDNGERKVEQQQVEAGDQVKKGDSKQQLHEILKRQDQQHKVKECPKINELKEKVASSGEAQVEPKRDEVATTGDDKPLSTSFNESGQRDNLAYTLANVLDLSDA